MVARPWSSSRLSCGERLLLRCDGNAGNSFPTKQGKDLLFDAAYEIFIEEENIPHSIYELDGADKCAIEICSLSKRAVPRAHMVGVDPRLERQGSAGKTGSSGMD